MNHALAILLALALLPTPEGVTCATVADISLNIDSDTYDFTTAELTSTYTSSAGASPIAAIQVIPPPTAEATLYYIRSGVMNVVEPGGYIVVGGDYFHITLKPGYTTTSFSYALLDSNFCVSPLVTLTVTAGAPLAASNIYVETGTNAAYSFTFQDFSRWFSGTLSAVKASKLPSGSEGKLKLNGADYTAGTAVIKVDLDAGNFKFVPKPGFHGTADFKFKLSDGTRWSTAATATVAVDRVPRSGDVALVTRVNKALTLKYSKFSDKFQDPDPVDTLAAIQVTKLPSAAAGRLKLNGANLHTGGIVNMIDLETGRCKFVPQSGFQGTTAFQFKVFDSLRWSTTTATATVSVGTSTRAARGLDGDDPLVDAAPGSALLLFFPFVLLVLGLLL
jgi:hypothetical protein